MLFLCLSSHTLIEREREKKERERDRDKRGSKARGNTGKHLEFSFKGEGVFTRAAKGELRKQGFTERKNKILCGALCHVQPSCAQTARNFSVQRCEPIEASRKRD